MSTWVHGTVPAIYESVQDTTGNSYPCTIYKHDISIHDVQACDISMHNVEACDISMRDVETIIFYVAMIYKHVITMHNV